jgi:uncharacterized membrane protein
MNFTDGLTNENTLSKKLSSIICGLLVSSLVIKLLMDLLMKKARQKQIYRFNSVGISINEYNILPIEMLYVISIFKNIYS